jgi:DNA primase
MINIIKLFKDFNIPHLTEGKNCQAGWVNTNCPFCNDKSNHLGYNLTGHYFNCWHCGKLDLYKVIKRLTHGNVYEIIKKYSISTAVRQHLKKKEIIKKKLIVPETKLKQIHKKYLIGRNFDPDFLIKKYDLRGTINVPNGYKYRIIAPIYYKGEIVSFQGRDVTGKQELRYKACKQEREVVCHQNILYNLDNCKKEWIVIVEGITDVWRLGDNSASVFGIEYTPYQVSCLSSYKTVFTIFDDEEEAQKQAKRIGKDLKKLGVKVYNITGIGENDPAKLKQSDANYLMKHLF